MGAKKLKQSLIAKIELEGHTFDLPLIHGSEGEKAIDISQLRSATGYVTLDPAFVNTASCDSKITYLDGENGILRYRGYPIQDLAEHASFTQVAYLLIHGELPSESELEEFDAKISEYSQHSQTIKNMMKVFPKDAHPMGVLSSLMVTLSSEHPEYLAQDLSPKAREEVILKILAQIKNLTALTYRVANGLDPVESDPDLSYCEDFYSMMFKGTEYEKLEPEVLEALNILLILHADHEQNCSTSTVRLVGSSKANPFATIASGINGLWGPLHGGANQAVIEMLEEIQNKGGDYKEFLEKAKDKNDPFKLMGFGHRVYKNFDPRAQIIKKVCDSVLDKLGIDDPLLDIAKGLESEALKDPYFVDRKLYPNVDFYSGIIYKALKIPTTMFTAMFALGRTPGWLAQWKELIESPSMKIGRPRQVYQGEKERKFKK